MTGVTIGRLDALASLQGAESLNQAAGYPGRQAQFSRQIRELEEACGQELVNREGLALRLTRKGREVVRLYEQLNAELLDERPERTPGEIVVAGGEMVLINWVIPRVTPILEESSTVVRFRNMRSLDALQGFRRGDVDLVVSSREPDLASKEGQSRRISQGGYVVVGGARRVVSKAVQLSELVKKPLVLLEGETPVRKALEKEAERQNRKLKVGVLCSTYEQVMLTAQLSGWMGVVPGVCRRAAEGKKVGVRMLEGGDELEFSLWVLWKRSRSKVFTRILSALNEGK